MLRNRDCFPVGKVPDEGSSKGGLSRGVRQRISRRRACVSRANDSIEVLNSLDDPYFLETASAPLDPVLGQSLLDEFATFPPAAAGGNAEEAFRALLGSSAAYDADDSQTLASYKRGLVALPGMSSAALPGAELMDSQAANILETYETEMLLEPDDFASRINDEGVVTPFTDPKLKNSPCEYEPFVSQPFHEGIVGFTDTVRAEAGMFFVAKKTGRSGS